MSGKAPRTSACRSGDPKAQGAGHKRGSHNLRVRQVEGDAPGDTQLIHLDTRVAADHSTSAEVHTFAHEVPSDAALLSL